VIQVNASNGILCHAWSPDRKRIAVCEASKPEVVVIYAGADMPDRDKWVKEYELKDQHDSIVAAVDWSPVHNKIVTCSHDRNAFVWTLTDNVWEPSLSILRITRAALDVKWSPNGKKFAVASGAKVVPVCRYDNKEKWWFSKMIKKHRSTVTSVAWHPNSQLVATASTDFRCRIFSTFDPDPEVGDQSIESPFGATGDKEFGDLLIEFDASQGWIHDVVFSPSGNRLAFTGHDSTVSFVELASSSPPICQTLRSSSLPAIKLLFLSETVLVAVGHEMKPEIYQANGGNWSSLGFVDREEASSGKSSSSAHSKVAATSSFTAARSLWANKTVKGQNSGKGSDDLWTKHHRCITELKAYSGTQSAATIDAFSTSAMDGRIVIWGGDIIKSVPGISL